jgi:hypothetical protein
MKLLKKLVKQSLAGFGYQIHRADVTIPVQVHFDNFVNLSQAYEHRLNESNLESCILPNSNRPKLLGRLLGTPPSEAYFIVQALAKCARVDGDVCEFGVAQGHTSALIANEIASSGKVLHLFDSFEGLPNPTEKDQLKDDIFSLGKIAAYTGTMNCSEDMVLSRLDAISFPKDRYVLHRGFFENIVKTDKALPKKVSFAYVDFDFYEPIKLALEYLNETAAPGAIFIVDDYDFFSTGGKAAVDEFVREKNGSAPRYECFVPDVKYGHFAVLEKTAA